MARPMEFDRGEALSRAVDALWGNGYGAISANDLANEMGIAKSSFYNTFGSKVELLQEAVAYYTDMKTVALQRVARGRNVLAELRALLIDIAKRNDDGRGCLLVNTAVELGRRDADVARITRAGFSAMAATFEALIVAGQRAGHINRDLDAAGRALTLVAGIAGLRVLVQTGFSAKQLKPYVDTILAGMAA
jgi:TetR/AcrR family transcriptional regulator, transcriptional repressor for nem operon